MSSASDPSRPPVWTAEGLAPLVTAFVRDRLASLRRQAGRAGEVPDDRVPDPGVLFSASPWLCDSLELLTLAAMADEAWGLSEAGLEDLLLARPSVERWAALTARAWNSAPVHISLTSSGSTGEGRKIKHPLPRLVREVTWAAGPGGFLAEPPHRLVSLVRPQHIYGFLWTVIYPALAGLAVVHASPLFRDFKAGDLVVLTPTHLRLWRTAAYRPPEGVRILCSTAPLDPGLEAWLEEAAVAPPLVELYGSSETSGLGWRRNREAGFRLFPWWDLTDSDQDMPSITDTYSGQTYPLPDHLVSVGPRRWRPAGRVDEAVQVGGVNVYPAQLASWLAGLPGVADARVRLDTSAGEPRLKALVVPRDSMEDTTTLETSLREAAASRFPSPWRPSRYSFLPAVPINAMGKESDWE